jgi:hypothetical protein
MGFGMGQQVGRNIMGGGNNRGRNNWGGGGGFNNNRGGRRRRPGVGGIGCGSEVFVILVFIFVAYWVMSNSGGIGFGSANIPRSTYERTRITNVADGNVLTAVDNTTQGGWFSDRRPMETGAQEAFNRTGVKFGIYVANTIDGNPRNDNDLYTFADNLYTEWFGDSPSHLLLVLIDLGRGEFTSWVITGASASTVFDDREALGILNGYLAHNWELADPDRFNPITEGQMFGDTLRKTAERIMTVTPSTARVVMPWVAGLIAIIIVFVGINTAIKNNAKRKLAAAEQERAAAELLAAPIAGLDGQANDPLLEKYNQNPDE